MRPSKKQAGLHGKEKGSSSKDKMKSMKLSPHFSEREFQCKCGCGICRVDPVLIKKLEWIRKVLGRSMTVKSGCRCKTHNKMIGGKSRSAHLTSRWRFCTAADIAVNGSIQRFRLVETALNAGIKRIGPHKRFVHLDVDENLPQNRLWLY